MNALRNTRLIVFMFVLWAPAVAMAMTGGQVLQLKQAGVSDESIRLMIQEKSVETVSLTIQEVLNLKAAGIDEDTLQRLIRGLSFLRDSQPVVHKISPGGLQIGSARDLVVLKEAGFSDETIGAMVTAAFGHEDRQRYEEALRMLEHLNIWVSPRPSPKHRP